MQNRICDLISVGLQKKYCKSAGPIQEVEITFDSQDKIHIKKITYNKKLIKVDFLANLRETKVIYAENENPEVSYSFFNNVDGTLFINNEKYDDLILEF